jgi:hypothetical protein
MSDAKNEILRKTQEIINRVPTLVVGSGASAALGIPGMHSLQQHLAHMITPETQEEQELWTKFIQESAATDLESALQKISLNPKIEKQVVRTTHQYIYQNEIPIVQRLVNREKELPLTFLYNHLFRSTHRRIDVVTPNYDRLAEYAADMAGYACSTGFSYGHIQHWYGERSVRMSDENGRVRTVNILKVHGSLDWFRDKIGNLFAMPFPDAVPDSSEPVIITPGVQKYKYGYYEPFRTTIARADRALTNTSGFMTIGYGFNDSHLQEKLIDGVYRRNIPILLLARTLTESARNFIADTRAKHFVAIEECGNGSKVYTDDELSGTILPDDQIWDLGHLMAKVST